MLTDLISKFDDGVVDFYRDFYQPMGGLKQVLRTRSPQLLKEALTSASREIGFAVEVTRVCHDHSLRLRNRNIYRVASLQHAASAVSKLLKASDGENKLVNEFLRERSADRTVDAANCGKKAAAYQPAAALIYAASSMSLERFRFNQDHIQRL